MVHRRRSVTEDLLLSDVITAYRLPYINARSVHQFIFIDHSTISICHNLVLNVTVYFFTMLQFHYCVLFI